MRNFKKIITAISLMAFWVTIAFSQGVTTASIKGKIVDQDNKPMEGATVILVHQPSGTQYGTITNTEGRFKLQGMRVGGPYEVNITSIGYHPYSQKGIYLNLNQTPDLSFQLIQSEQKIEEVTVVYDKSDVISSDRTGAETSVMSNKLENLPTIARGQQDFTRLTPQSDGNSFGGRNNLYNNFSLDGSIFNNSFGLDYATPGGQSDAQPVSLDAIEQIQVSLAPFDVREGGFTGAGINAVTKSGTNEFKATVYNYFRNQKMIGSKVAGVDAQNLDFSTNLFGFSVGGAIIKNKLFYFVNAEGERRDQLAHGFKARDNASQTDANVTSVWRDSIQAVHDHLLNEWGYEAGSFENYNHQTYNNKFLAKLDWNINKKNTFTIRYNYLDAWKDILPHPEAIIGRGPTSYRLPFENESYRIFNKINSVVSELNSRITDRLSNKLLLGYTAFRDRREPKSAAFPVIDIFDQNGNLAISAGSEMFSTHNILTQDIYQLTDNMTYYGNKHNITGGFNLEVFQFDNSFNLFYYPWHTFNSVQEFLNTTKTDVDFNQEVADAQKNDYAWSSVDVAQLGVYVQDEFSVSDNFTLTAGLRVDVPIYLNSIEPDANIQNFDGWVDSEGNAANVDPSQWPKANLLWAPRLGFNWDVTGDKKIQLRGGSGIFTGRIPFVWLGNQASNAKLLPGYTFQINATEENFKFPQVWKNDLALDVKFGKGWTATVEALYSKDINAVVHRNYNMQKPSAKLSGTGDDRAIFGGFNEVNIYSSSSNPVTFLDAGAIVLENVKEGYQSSVTGELKKDFDFGLSLSAAYTYLVSKDYTSIPAEIAADAFQRNPVIGDPNQPMLSWSRYGLKHRIISTIMYAKEYKNMVSNFAVFFEAGQGNRYSYSYAGDLNQDAIANNDLIYVPKNASDIHFGTIDGTGNGVEATDAAEQWSALDAFIEQDPYLKTRRGMYAERNGAMLPWYTQLDFKFAQDFNIKVKEKKNTIRVSLDILNMGNMINSNWGVRKFASTWNPISVNGLDNNNVPYFSFDKNLTSSYINDFSNNSKWQLQIGVRYIFN